MKTTKRIAIALMMVMTLQAFSADVILDKRNSNDLVLNDTYESFRFEPIIKQNDDFIKLGLTNPEKKNVDIIVKDMYGYELVNIQNLNDLFIKKTFDVRDLPKGKYTFFIKTSKNTFTNVITVK